MDATSFTPEENRWIKRLQRLGQDMPESLKAYVIDGASITVCQAGTSSYNLSKTINIDIEAGAMLTDLHDGTDFGRR